MFVQPRHYLHWMDRVVCSSTINETFVIGISTDPTLLTEPDMEEIIVTKIWMGGVLAIMISYFVLFGLFSRLGKNRRQDEN